MLCQQPSGKILQNFYFFFSHAMNTDNTIGFSVLLDHQNSTCLYHKLSTHNMVMCFTLHDTSLFC